MIFSRKLLQYMEFTTIEDEGCVVVIEADDTSQLLEEEIQQGVAALSTLHVDSEEYSRGSESVKNLCEAVEKHDKMLVERRKVDLQIAEANRRRAVDWGQMTPKLVSIAAYAGVTCVLLALERQTPLSMRWLKALEVLLAPKGI